MYKCSTCEKPAQFVDNKIVKTCKCPGGVTANMAAAAAGKSLMNQKK